MSFIENAPEEGVFGISEVATEDIIVQRFRLGFLNS